MAAQTEFVLVLTTAGSDDEASSIAQAVVGRRLAACVNITAAVTSVYRWDGELRQDEERLLLIKTRTDRLEPLQATILELHSYDCPEFITLPVTGGSAAYLDWLRKETVTTG